MACALVCPLSPYVLGTVLTFISLESGETIKCSQIVICTGTFLSGEIHIGLLFSCQVFPFTYIDGRIEV